MHCFGGVAVVGVGRIENLVEFGLRVVGLVGDFELGLGVLALEHEVVDDRGRGVVAEGDDDGGCEMGRL